MTKKNKTILIIVGILVVLGVIGYIMLRSQFDNIIATEFKPIQGTTCETTENCESNYEISFSNCACAYILRAPGQYVDCQVVCPEKLIPPKPIGVECINNICNLQIIII